jgi:hypothetical protein
MSAEQSAVSVRDAQVGAPAPSSRTSARAAGWRCTRPGAYKQLLTRRDRPFSWLTLTPLWQSRNDRVARRFGDPTNGHPTIMAQALKTVQAALAVPTAAGAVP